MLEISLSCICKLKTVTDCIEFFRVQEINKRKEKCLMYIKLIFANARPSTVQCTSGNKGLAYKKLIYNYQASLSQNLNNVRNPETHFPSMVQVTLLSCYLDILKEGDKVTRDLQLYLMSDLSEENIFQFFHLISDKNIFTAQDFEQLKKENNDIAHLMAIPVDRDTNAIISFKSTGRLVGSNIKMTILYLYDYKLKKTVACKIDKKSKELKNEIISYIDANFKVATGGNHKQRNKQTSITFILYMFV